ncbi:MAG: MoxR family ATPase [Spirochaetales bacterium]|nr:MAG: MoxR family ATPase [Spirochaetales bacterium]
MSMRKYPSQSAVLELVALIAVHYTNMKQVHLEIEKLISNIRSIVYIDGKKLEYIIAAKIAGGHVMLADSHGVGKTSLARALAGSIQWEDEVPDNGTKIDSFSRIQCTVDLLPQDILGYTRFLSSSDSMIFTEGPIFAHFILCDEINLLTPKTQGSFFQVMEEQTVSIEGKTYVLPDPFFIIATMNLEGVHLFPLPAPQLDRFMLRVSMGFPEASVEAEIVTMHGKENSWANFRPVITSGDLLAWQALVDEVSIHPDVIEYIVALVRKTRSHPDVHMGGSPRAGIKVSRLARALALVRGDDYVSIDLIKEIFIPTVAHRIIMHDATRDVPELLRTILDSTPVEKRS